MSAEVLYYLSVEVEQRPQLCYFPILESDGRLVGSLTRSQQILLHEGDMVEVDRKAGWTTWWSLQGSR